MQKAEKIEKLFPRLSLPQKKALERLGIITTHDLLYHFPTRYSDMSNVAKIRDVQDGDTVTVYGRIQNPKIKKSFKGGVPMGEAYLEDLNKDRIKIIWFHQAFVAKTLKDGDIVKITGKISDGKYGRSITNPEFEQAPDMPIDTHDSLFASDETDAQKFGYPIYRESRGITSKWLYHALRKILSSEINEGLVDPIPEYILKTYNLPSLHSALVWIHMPQKKSDAEAARKRFAFEEVFMIQLAKQRDRKLYESHFSFQIKPEPKKTRDFIAKFPFTLTDAQDTSITKILDDMASERPMSRLLEGDVGSGKTAVAVTAAYTVASQRPGKQSYGNLQVAYMAPTEILASQHFESFIEYFKGSGMQIALITGSGCKKFPSKVDPSGWTTISRAQLLKWVKNGEIPILIGTHALIQKSVVFRDLGLVIIDEQHRFGTKQRMKLTQKDRAPHLLSMTATPIPRTLALTIYGDLDLSILDEMPAGRKKVETNIVPPNKRDGAYEKIHAELSAGRQIYIICPRIDEPDPEKETALQLKSVKAEAERLKKEVFF
jgi:ATP-dependent DNA helicase RecG